MSSKQYLLGTDDIELRRLGIQHQVWASEAQQGWDNGKFTTGDTILDFGCGPGYCSTELAYRVGFKGEIIAVDASKFYLDFLKQQIALHKLNINPIEIDLHELSLPNDMLDGAFCRWVLGWVDDADKIVGNVARSLKSGARIVIQEYYAWENFKLSPSRTSLNHAIGQAYQSFVDGPGKINIGAELPQIYEKHGIEHISSRPIVKLVSPSNYGWDWPKTFFKSYFPRLVDKGYLEEDISLAAINEMQELSEMDSATFLCPTVVEVVGVKR